MSDLPARLPSSVWRSVLAVVWAFVGLRQRSEFQQDTARVNPLHVIAVGLGLCFALVVGLMFFVKWVVAQ
jgi:Protein of unknown function (DUF2970)